MKALRWFSVCVSVLLATPALAQNWVVYTPPERDFRVLFPSQPASMAVSDGAVVYRAQVESGDQIVEYRVYRLSASTKVGNDEAQEIQRLLQQRVGDDVPVRRMREQEESPTGWQRYVFEYRRALSFNRLIGSGGRYYQLELFAPRGSAGLVTQTARDFFASFQASGISIPGLISGLSQGIETWCQGRTDPFSRAFCEYSVCLQAAFQQDPRCTALFKR